MADRNPVLRGNRNACEPEDLPVTHIVLIWNDNLAFEDEAVVG
jgi:hypothetical protein